MASETGKQRSQRIQIDYYRRRGGLHTFRNVCIAIGLVGAGLYTAFVLASGGGVHLSTGPVATSHAAFETDCQQCHQDFTPIDSQATKLNVAVFNVHSSDSIEHLETACQKCHAAGNHYRDLMVPKWQLVDQNCGTCHTDHQGRSHDLTAVASQACAACHAKLADICKASPTVKPDIVSFTEASHGDFASLSINNPGSINDPGVVKFDHHQHMHPGQVNDGDKGAFTIEMLAAALRPRYRKPGQTDGDSVQLDCTSCHQYAGNPDVDNSLIADGELGRYIAPISFDQHCSACHSMNPGLATETTTPIPHAAPWAKVELLLAATARGARATGQSRSIGDDTQTTPQPGEGLGFRAADNRSESVDVSAARAAVEKQCLQCHDQASISDQVIASAIAGTLPPMIPPRWFKRGLYDHAAHRRIDCRYCHEAAYPVDGEPASLPTDHDTVMIAGIESCTDCHRDATSPTPEALTTAKIKMTLSGQPTWASDDCTMCHRYHTPAEATP